MKKLIVLSLSVFLYANACTDLQSCIKTANFYQFDKEDEVMAVKFYKIACDEYNDYMSCKFLSDIYKYSQNAKNEKQSKIYQNKTIKIVKEKCEKNDSNACYDYANFCEVRYATAKNYEKLYKKAFDLYEKECNENNFSSCYYLANMYFNGIATEINENKAYDLYDFACENNDAKSCSELAQMHENKSLEYLRKSCELGFAYSCEKLEMLK